MTVRDAEPLVKMGIYSAQKKENLQIIAKWVEWSTMLQYPIISKSKSYFY